MGCGKQWVGWGLLIVALAGLGLPLTVAAERVALVIGNSGYAERPLKNPPNDARAMAALLRKLGFRVTEKTDLTLTGFRQQVNAFLDQSKGADLRLFYYSGHGASYDGDNYLLPIGHGVTRKHELPDQAYSLKTLLRGLKDQGGINLVLLDSCRDAPFGDAKSIWDDSKGMKPIQPQEGVLIGYAAQNGRTASDNSGESNSLYTKYLLQELGQALELREALMRVRQAVYDESHGEQRPTTEDEVLGKVHLAEASREPPPVTTGTLVIRNSQPPGAVISVDGNRKGAAPQTLTLKAGQHTIEAKQAGYADYRDTVQVRAGEQTVLNVVLTAISREPAVVTSAPVERPVQPPRPVAETLIGDRYRDNGDGTVTDVRTGLQWMRCSLGQTRQDGTCTGEAEKYTWQAALDAAKAYGSGWRVPTWGELLTLIYCSSDQPKTWNDTGEKCGGDYNSPAIYQAAFPNTPAMGFWSSSVYGYVPNSALLVSFSYGHYFSNPRTYDYPVRLVRDGR